MLLAAIICTATALADDKDCRDFTTQDQAQRYFESNGGSLTNNVDGLDADGNGVACESLLGQSAKSADAAPLAVSRSGSQGIPGELIVAVLAIGTVAVCFYFVEIHGAGNQRAPHPPNLPYNTRTMPYEAYLQTPEWAQIRKMALDRDGNKCTKCGSGDRLQAHHLTYARRGREKLKDLQTLCDPCHKTKS